MTMVKPSVRVNTSVSLGALLRQRVLSKIVPLLSVLVVVLSAGRGQAFHNGVPGTKVGAMVKGGIATTAAVSATTSKVIAGALTKIPQGNLAVSAILSAGTLLFSADQVKADNGGFGTCRSTNFPGKKCTHVTVQVQGCGQYQSNTDCCQFEGTKTHFKPCNEACNSIIGCCSCNDDFACSYSSNAVFYDGVCNGVSACAYSNNIRVYSGSCNNQYSCYMSPSVTVGSNSCNEEYSCANCCKDSCDNYENGNIVIPNGECNDPGIMSITSCPWCPMCGMADGTSCYNSVVNGQATLSDAGISDRRALQTKKSKQKDKKSKETPMSCVSAKEKIVSYFQAQGIPKLRSKYTIGKLAKTSKQEGQRKRSRDCNVELSWLFEHLEGDEIVQACAELENQKPKLQAYLGNHWTIENLKCTPEDKNKIH